MLERERVKNLRKGEDHRHRYRSLEYPLTPREEAVFPLLTGRK